MTSPRGELRRKLQEAQNELDGLRRGAEWHKITIDALHAEVNRLRGIVGEEPLAPDIWHLKAELTK